MREEENYSSKMRPLWLFFL